MRYDYDFLQISRQDCLHEDVIWIDLFSPYGDEKRTVEKFLDTEIQSRAQAEEIESSSRFSETDTAIFANTNFLIPGPEEYAMEAVSFTLVGNVLTTLRDVPLRSFTELQRKMQAVPRLFPNGYWVFVSIMDQRVDLDADMIELMSKEIAQYSKRINQQEDINEDFLLDINQLQDNTMTVRENIVDKQRLISNMITLISLLLMPPTLVASFYGMNVELPLSDKPWSWVLICGFMIFSLAIILYLFKRRKML